MKSNGPFSGNYYVIKDWQNTWRMDADTGAGLLRWHHCGRWNAKRDLRRGEEALNDRYVSLFIIL